MGLEAGERAGTKEKEEKEEEKIPHLCESIGRCPKSTKSLKVNNADFFPFVCRLYPRLMLMVDCLMVWE